MNPIIVNPDQHCPELNGNPPCIRSDQLQTVDAASVEYWILDGRDWQAMLPALQAIRQNPSPTVYLKPVLCLTGDQPAPAEILRSVDQTMPFANFQGTMTAEMATPFRSIDSFIQRLPDALQNHDMNVAYKMLRFMASRGKPLEAVTTIRHPSGFVYPSLLPFYSGDDDSVLSALEFLESQQLIKGAFQSKAYFCHLCGSAFLNFLETCPDCGSADLEADDLLHHFKCAHTAPTSQFRHDDRLTCPKCERELHHIGVDYDKPSMIFRCNHCSSTFQDPAITTTCFQCGHTASPEHQVHRTIRRYSVTAIGANTAIYGLDQLFTRLLGSQMRLFSATEFKNFLAIEAARIRRYQRNASSLMLLDMQDLGDLYLKLGSRAKEFFEEMVQIFKAVLRESDVISSRSETVFMVLLTETPHAQAEIAVQRLTTDIGKLFESQLHRPPTILSQIIDIQGNLNLNTELEQFLNADDR